MLRQLVNALAQAAAPPALSTPPRLHPHAIACKSRRPGCSRWAGSAPHAAAAAECGAAHGDRAQLHLVRGQRAGLVAEHVAHQAQVLHDVAVARARRLARRALAHGRVARDVHAALRRGRPASRPASGPAPR